MDMQEKPNILYILADDMGYGDVSCLNPQGKLHTPNLDRLAGEGMAFTDAHASSAVCTPSRYSILTGRYNWRSARKSGVGGGYAEPLVEEGRLTVAELLRRQGYRTHCIGKWHLGLEFPPDLQELQSASLGRGDGTLATPPACTGPIRRGPVDCGFDSFFGISASLDMPPYAYIQNDRFTQLPTQWSERKRQAGQGDWWRGGAAAPDFRHETVLETLTQRVLETMRQVSDRPYFIYFPLNAPHTPILPSKEYRGKSGLGPYGDYVLMCDGMVGKLLEQLDQSGQADNTMVVFASDNGCSPEADYPHLLANGHNPSYVFRGMKSDIYEGGHRIPLLVRWPKGVRAGQVCSQMVCLTDFMATVAELLDIPLPDDAAEDSVSNLPLWRGGQQPVRETIVHHSIDGSFSIRSGPWKLELCPGSGGWSDPSYRSSTAGLPPVQLYRLDGDLRESCNLQEQCPEIVQQLRSMLLEQIQNGRSTPGAPQKNTGPEIWEQYQKILEMQEQPEP